jgi:hypothetical protein
MIQRTAVLLMERFAYDGRTEETERLDQPLGDFIKRKGSASKYPPFTFSIRPMPTLYVRSIEIIRTVGQSVKA